MSSIMLKSVSVFFLGFFSMPLSWADDAPVMEEVSIHKAYVANQGFDDNDNVQMVLDVVLPDPCYILADTKQEINNANEILVRQYAWRRHDGVCGTGDMLGEASTMREVPLGRLKAGAYSVKFRSDNNQMQTRPFGIEVAQEPTVDNFRYPSVTNLIVNDVFFADEDVKVVLAGQLNYRCSKLQDPVKIQRVGDVIILLPIEGPMDSSRVCGAEAKIGFKKEVSLGKLLPGEYLVQARSRHGATVNHLIQVKP